ncbi:hypothetical protein [Candidatus Binatus soli]|jgi:hypothetical protein|uniref:hypothetical protein n=1 Tax=Candidatus Binatus soli TaxID=1953413 RepID=UPI003D0F8A3C
MEELVQQILTAPSENAEPAGGNGVRFAQNRFLDELPGAAFAAITLVWLFMSLASLTWMPNPPPNDAVATIGTRVALAELKVRQSMVAKNSRQSGHTPDTL